MIRNLMEGLGGPYRRGEALATGQARRALDSRGSGRTVKKG